MSDLAYILSPSYSGSTLLTLLLGTHPQVATIGELKATARGDVERYQCSCGVRMLACSFWLALQDDLARSGFELDLHDLGTHFTFPHRPLGNKVLRTTYRGGSFERVRRLALKSVPGWRSGFSAILQRNRILVDAVLRRQGANVFLDGSKDPMRLRYLLDADCWKVKVIRLIRDGRGSSSSYMRVHNLSLEKASREWREAQDECDRVARELGSSTCMFVRYEELCKDPNRTLNRIFRFLGLDPKGATTDYLSVEHHVLGHAMRVRSNGQIMLNEKWKSTWTHSELDTFDRIAGRSNRRHGYV